MSKSESDKIICLECGKYFDFLAPHINKAHQMTLIQYRERWKIPKQKPLASIKHRQWCSDVTNERIKRGDLSPVVQVEMMKDAYKNSSNRRTASQLARERASETAYRHQIWKKSPAIKTVSPELKREAIKRMRERPASKELVKDIAADLNLSISRLYAWLKQDT
ncbi:ROS/MUCR transcriptional regulator domain protein [Salmonella enterica]|nr:ROS/MUCR transcriptional regulator domain protein [Salmonella enterica]